jgi:hypothetical protein
MADYPKIKIPLFRFLHGAPELALFAIPQILLLLLVERFSR